MLQEETFPLQNAAARSSFCPSVQRGLGAELRSWLRGHGCGLGAEGLHAPNPASPTRRTPAEWVSVAGDPQQSSRTQGARGSPAPLCPLESGGRGAKTDSVAFLSRGAMGLLFAARGDFPFAECCQQLVLGLRCNGASALSCGAGSGGMDVAWAQKAFTRPILLPQDGEPVRSGFGAQDTTSKAVGPREPRAAPPRFALWRAEGRGRKRLALLS